MKSSKYIIDPVFSVSIKCLCLFILLLSSCVDDELVKKEDKIIEGIPTKLQLSYVSTTPIEVQTKAALETEDEYRVDNLYVLVFNNTTGEKEYGHLFPLNELNIEHKKTSPKDETTKGSVSFEITSGEKRIYAVANVPVENESITSLSKTLDKIEKIDELLDNNVILGQKTIYRSSGKLLMSGAFVDERSTKEANQTEGYCNILPSDNTVRLSQIKLKRVDARVTFNIGASNAGAGERDITFTAKQWRVVNVPLKTSLYSKGNIENNSYFPYPESDYINFETTNPDTKRSAFTFYMMENSKSTTALTAYWQREKQKKTSLETGYLQNGAFEYADPNATYVILTGDYLEKYTENGQIKERTANVTYTIHLGYVGNKVNDFDCKRNTAYIYNVTIEGVDKIRLEVTSYDENGKTQEDEPGAEGDIVETDKFYPFDAHFCRSIITFNKNAIEGKAGFKVKTPFDEGYYTLTGTEAGSKAIKNAIDYKWLCFARNEKYTSGKQKGVYNKNIYISYNPKNVIYLDELLNELKVEKNYDTKNEIVYTMFIDEFYYDKDPRPDKSASSTFWKEFVNVPNREMHILCNTNYSQDKESSLTTSSIMISQRSIKTFYNVGAAGLETAWGIETVNETGLLTPPDDNPWNYNDPLKSEYLSESNGRWNFFAQTKVSNNNKWADYISNNVKTSTDKVPDDQLNSNLTKGNKLVWACLQRNRDEDGNEKIEAKEIKWYPAAINQLTDIWMGKDALPVEAHLYPNGSKIYWRYLSSNGKELYAEEGSSINNYKFQYYNSIPGAIKPTQHDYRCVRNLGAVKLEKPEKTSDGIPADYVQHDPLNKKFTLTYMAPASLRGEADIQKTEFAIHDELNPMNRPYYTFEYADVQDTENTEWKPKNDLVTAGKSPCKDLGEGWRLPNQRELALMASRVTGGWKIENEDVYCWSRTKSSLSGKANLGYGGWHLFMSIPAGPKYIGPVRCVRDKQ